MRGRETATTAYALYTSGCAAEKRNATTTKLKGQRGADKRCENRPILSGVTAGNTYGNATTSNGKSNRPFAISRKCAVQATAR